jgi:ribulose 1,5-bisphosphate synthetase/thiazole synthase
MKRHGYENDLAPLLKKHSNNFVFLDAVKLADRVLDELQICYENKAKYVAVHDTSKHYRQPRLAMKRAIKLGWYELVDEINIESDSKRVKGVSLLKLIK